MDDDDIDPTSMLEVTTSLPNDNYCMDLTTERSCRTAAVTDSGAAIGPDVAEEFFQRCRPR